MPSSSTIKRIIAGPKRIGDILSGKRVRKAQSYAKSWNQKVQKGDPREKRYWRALDNVHKQTDNVKNEKNLRVATGVATGGSGLILGNKLFGGKKKTQSYDQKYASRGDITMDAGLMHSRSIEKIARTTIYERPGGIRQEYWKSIAGDGPLIFTEKEFPMNDPVRTGLLNEAAENKPKGMIGLGVLGGIMGGATGVASGSNLGHGSLNNKLKVVRALVGLAAGAGAGVLGGGLLNRSYVKKINRSDDYTVGDTYDPGVGGYLSSETENESLGRAKILFKDILKKHQAEVDSGQVKATLPKIFPGGRN